jgi:hypothetical protein
MKIDFRAAEKKKDKTETNVTIQLIDKESFVQFRRRTFFLFPFLQLYIFRILGFRRSSKFKIQNLYI